VDAGSSCVSSVEGLASAAGVLLLSDGTSSCSVGSTTLAAASSLFLSLFTCFALFSLDFLPIVYVKSRVLPCRRSPRAAAVVSA
jgi:hypothetical protein